ncbi:MAG: hypothetical protein OXN17_18560 [Candidatus Poribacteria bacterium]|nr:hypothetical protein [Candidatus Poribacteria bacterium]MDE0506817.1 hypothetical protein [Candidatus Poribacteria bacterium]
MNDFQKIYERQRDEEISPPVEVPVEELFDKHAFSMSKALVEEKLANIEHKNKYVKWIFVLVATWLAVLVLIVIAEGINFFGFCLHKDIVITIITTTTVPVVGLLGYIIRALFKQ